jgi:hypothetical protein
MKRFSLIFLASAVFALSLLFLYEIGPEAWGWWAQGADGQGEFSKGNTIGSVTVSSTPVQGGRILLDFFDTGEDTNATLPYVAPGSHRISVSHGSYLTSQVRTVNVQEGTTVSTSINLDPGNGSIKVASTPQTEDGKIYLDYQDTGSTTTAGGTVVSPVAAGTHYVMVRRNSYSPSGWKEVVVSAGEQASVECTLSATESYSLVITSTPSGADIYLDYQDTGEQTPATISTLGSGSHSVVVRKTAYLIPAPQTQELSEGTPTATIDFTLIPEPRVYVSTTTGSDVTGEGTKQNPWATIGKALQTISPSKTEPITICVAAGTYYEYELGLKEYSTVLGGFNPDDWSRNVAQYRTIVDGSQAPGSGDDIFDGADHSTLEGLIIQYAPDKGVMAEFASVTVIECTIQHCNPAVSIREGAMVKRSVIVNNSTGISVYANTGYSATIQNNLIIMNDANGIYCNGNVRLINNTIDGNGVDGVRIAAGGLTDPTILVQNCNLTRNGDDGLDIDSSLSLTHITTRYNNVWGNSQANYDEAAEPSEGDISADPLYTSPPPGRIPYYYALPAVSPSVDAGTDSLAPSVDIDGNTRPVNYIVDIGCYEFQGVSPFPPQFIKPLTVLLRKGTFSAGDRLCFWALVYDSIMDCDLYAMFRKVGHKEIYSLVPRRGFVKGIHRAAGDIQEFHTLRIFSPCITIPQSVHGDFKVFVAVLPAGWEPTVRNAKGKFGQLASASFTVE